MLSRFFAILYSSFSKNHTFLKVPYQCLKLIIFVLLYMTRKVTYYSKNDHQISQETKKYQYYETLDIKPDSSLILRYYTKNEYQNYNFYRYLPSISDKKKFMIIKM